MGKAALGEYLEAMRQRHPRLSKRRMAIDAGVNSSAVQQIIAGRTGASPSILKALADRWGDENDYRELMRLAGHPLPGPAAGQDEAAEREAILEEILQILIAADTDRRLEILRLARDILKDDGSR